MKILIINAHNVQLNPEKRILQGPLYLGASLKLHHHKVKFVDLQVQKVIKGEGFNDVNFMENEMTEVMESYQPDFIALSIHYSGAFLNGMKIGQFLKENWPDVPIVAGGHHTTIFAKETLDRFPHIDYILKGECEETLPQLIYKFENKLDPSKIDGLAFRDETGQVIENEKKDWIEFTDGIPFPDYSLIDLKNYHFDTSQWFNPKGHEINFSMPLLSSRSCPFKCSYCAMFLAQGPSIRLRSPENVVDEIQYYYEHFGQKYFSFIDDNFAFKRQRVIDICNLIHQRGLDIQLDTTNGYDLNFVYDDIMAALISVGFLRSSFSIESGHEEMRMKHMNKPLKQKRIYDAYEILNKYKNSNEFDFTTLFVIGMPEETHETLQGTKDIIIDLQLHKIAMGFAIPYPGTKLFEKCMENDLFVVKPDDFLTSDLYNHADQVCLKPYELEVEDVSNFRKNIYANIASFSSNEFLAEDNNKNNSLANW